MKKVLASGNRRDRFYLFKCDECGCVFESDLNDVSYEYGYDEHGVHNSTTVWTRCPECDLDCRAVNPKGYTKEERDRMIEAELPFYTKLKEE